MRITPGIMSERRDIGQRTKRNPQTFLIRYRKPYGVWYRKPHGVRQLKEQGGFTGMRVKSRLESGMR
jgi:hypothetical protein